MNPDAKQFFRSPGASFPNCSGRAGTTNTRTVKARALALLAGMWALFAAPAMSSAAQFVLFDVTFPFTKADADNATPNKSHFYVKDDKLNPQRPRDWTAPVDYRNGTVHLRIEVLEKPPGGEPTIWSICYIPNKGQGHGYGCIGTDLYREKGVYEKDVSMKSFWQNDQIIWTEGIKRMDLVMKDGSGGGGHVHKRPDPEKFFPTRIRMTLIQVSAGSTYDPGLVPNLPRKTSAAEGRTLASVSATVVKSDAGAAQSVCCGKTE